MRVYNIKHGILLLFILLFTFNANAGSNSKKEYNSNLEDKISITNSSGHHRKVIIYVRSDDDTIVKWVRIGSYQVANGDSISFNIESINGISNYAFKVQGGEYSDITRFFTPKIKIN